MVTPGRWLPILRIACALLWAACGNDDAAPPPAQDAPITLPDGRVCRELRVYLDDDGDGFGVREETRDVCLADDEEVAGFARSAGDCAPDDPRVSPVADEICGDNLDENCEPADEACPESLSAAIQRPDWDCVNGSPPDRVLAWAVFDDNESYKPGACFLFYEGLPGEFYVEPVNLEPTDEKVAAGPMGECEAVEGCICPSVENWSYDRGRLYAFTLRGAPEDCDKIVVTSQAGSEQVVSNECRKFLFQIWFNPNEFSFVADDEGELRRRLERFPSVEVACFEGQPFDDLPFASLLTARIQINESFQPRGE